MNKLPALVTVFVLALCLLGCDRRASRTSSDPELEKVLAEAVELFVEHSLPNTMAREPGFDINAHLADIEQRRKQITKVFHTPGGAAYLADRVDREDDEMAVLAILRILFESGEPTALPVFQKYAHHSSPVVSKSAGEYMTTFKIREGEGT